MLERKNIIVLGAGFGGLRAARRINRLLKGSPGFSQNHRNDFRIILIDKNDYQTYTPVLYDVATTPASHADALKLKGIATFPIVEAITGENIKFIQDEVVSINIVSNYIHFKYSDPLHYAYLIVALGSEPNYFNIKGLQEYCLSLKTFKDSIAIRDRFTHLLIEKKGNPTNVVVGGAGPTGVEFAGELAQAIKKGHWREYLKGEVIITLVEGRKTILNGFHPRTILYAQNRLGELGIKIVTDKIINSVTKETINFSDKTSLPYDIIIWTGGTKPSSLTDLFNLRKESSGHLTAGSNLLCFSESPLLDFSENVFAIGDVLCFRDPKTGKPLPGIARIALSQADLVAYNITSHIKEGKNLKAYRPHEWPYLIPVGGKWVIAKIGPVVLAGFIGWIIKLLVELNYLISVLPLHLAVRTWVKSIATLTRND